jgi:hypothetical protein
MLARRVAASRTAHFFRMEQATVPEAFEFELSGFLKTERGITPFLARISAPKARADGTDFSCSVHAPLLAKRDKEVFGASAEQARRLALQFLKSLLAGKNLVDKGGRKVDLNQLG